PPDTAARPAWPGSEHAPGAAPTAWFRLAPPVPIAPGRRAQASLDQGAVLPGSVVQSAYPGPARAPVDSPFRQTGSDRRYTYTPEIHPADRSSADAVRLRIAHSARSLEVNACPLRATPGRSSR